MPVTKRIGFVTLGDFKSTCGGSLRLWVRGVFRSASNARQFRIDPGSLVGDHPPGVPHVHLEGYSPGAARPHVNNHIPFVDGR